MTCKHSGGWPQRECWHCGAAPEKLSTLELVAKLRESPVIDTLRFTIKASRNARRDAAAEVRRVEGVPGTINEQFDEAYSLLLQLLGGPHA